MEENKIKILPLALSVVYPAFGAVVYIAEKDRNPSMAKAALGASIISFAALQVIKMQYTKKTTEK